MAEAKAAAAPVQPGRDLDFESWRETFGTDGKTAQLFRDRPKVWTFGDGEVTTKGFLAAYDGMENFPELKDIEENYGGGSYRILGRRPNGTHLSKVTFDIAGPPKMRGAKPSSGGEALALQHEEKRRAERRDIEDAAREREAELREQQERQLDEINARHRSALESAREVETGNQNTMLRLLQDDRDRSATERERFLDVLAEKEGGGNEQTHRLIQMSEERVGRLQDQHRQEMTTVRAEHRRAIADLHSEHSRALATMRESHDREIAVTKSDHDRRVTRAETRAEDDVRRERETLTQERERHTRELEAGRKDAEWSLDQQRTQHDHAVKTMETTHAHVVAMKESVIARLERDLHSRTEELAALTKRKDSGPLEQLTALAALKEGFSNIMPADEGPGILSSVLGQVAATVTERFALGPASTSQAIDVLQAEPTHTHPTLHVPLPPTPTQNPQRPPAVADYQAFVGWESAQPATASQAQIPSEYLSLAVPALEGFYATKTQPRSVVQRLGSVIPVDLRMTLSQPDGLETFLTHVGARYGESALLTPSGRAWLHQVSSLL